MKNRVQIAIGFLAIVLSFTLGYSLGNAEYVATEEFQGNLRQAPAHEAEATAFDVLSIEEAWNAQTHGLEVSFELENSGATGEIGEYNVKTHLRVETADRRINFIENAAGYDERSIEKGERVMIQTFIPADEELGAMIESAGYEVKLLEVEL